MSVQTNRRTVIQSLPNQRKKKEQGLDFSMFSYPEKSLAAFIDLVHKSQIPMPLVPLNLINTNSFNVRQIDMLSSPFDGHLNASEYVFPAGLKCIADISPAHSLCPPSQKPLVSIGQMAFSLSPRNGFNRNTTTRAVNSPHGVNK